MRRPKLKVCFFVLSLFLNINMITGCSAVKTAINEVISQNSLEELANEANGTGLQLYKDGQLAEALTYFEKALEYATQYNDSIVYNTNANGGVLMGNAYNNLCLVYNDTDEYETSLEYGNLAVQVNPDSSNVHSNRGNSYMGLGRYEEALSDYNKAIELNDKNSYGYYGKGLAHYRLEAYQESLETFESYLVLKPEDIDAYEYMIWCYYYLMDYDKGLEISDKAIQTMQYKNFDIYDGKGSIIQAKEGFEKAEIFYKEVAAQNRNEVDAQMLLGECYYNNKDYKKALACYLVIDETFPPNTELHCWIVSCYTALKDMENADAYFEKVLAAGDATVDLCNYIGDEFTYQELYMESLKYYDEAIRIDKKEKEAYINKIYSLYYGKRFTRCIEFAKASLEEFENDYDILFYIAECNYWLSDYVEALTWYERALKVKPNSDYILSYISDTYSLLEDYENAKKYADEALHINRDNTTAMNIKATIVDRQRPIEDQIEDFIKSYYLYDNRNVDQMFQSDRMANEDINNALDQLKKEDDKFTFCIYDSYYDDYYEYYMNDVEYKDYGYMNYIRIPDFNQNTDHQMIEILDSIDDPENSILTIDLRMNGGGDTKAANNILDVLLPSCVTCTLIYKDGYTYNYYSDASSIKFKKIYVLVDEESASASELLTLGLKTYLNNVTVIGNNTYGKGVGQLVFEDKKQKLMVFLVNHYWNVREQNIMNIGIAPDAYVKSKELSDYIDVIQERK